MTDVLRGNPAVRRLAKGVLRPLVSRLDQLTQRLEVVADRQDELSARVEQLGRTQDRLAAYQDRLAEELHAEVDPYGPALDGVRSVVDVLVPRGREAEAGAALRNELDHVVRAATDLVRAELGRVEGDLAELRRSNRLTQALAERAIGAAAAPVAPAATAGGAPGAAEQEPTVAVPAVARPSYRHPAPGTDLLYRAFEDRHRGSVEQITDRQRTDYLELLGSLDHPELPVADLGCGRGELVQLLLAEGHRAVGVDSNTGQVIEGPSDAFVEEDLFAWLDQQEDASLRAVVSLHVVEHLPPDLQIRLVFESARVLAPGGLMVLETPNTMSLSIGASNFWVDPTHERPVHPLFLEFLASEAGFGSVRTDYLHPVPAELVGPPGTERLVGDLNSLLLGPGDLAVVATR
ncbi:MAG: methyltransferase domain-containing protein [Microthrixaceae bacterium]